MSDRDRRLGLDVTWSWPLLVLAAAFLIATAFRTERLIEQRVELGTVRFAQERAVRDGQKLRAQLDQLADATARLAAGGDANAKAIVDAMGRQGVTLRQKP